jgi:putative spermidine/putrescine transport system permease protein
MTGSTAALGRAPRSRLRASALDWLYRRPRAAVVLILTPPVGWMGVAYFGSLALLFVSAFWYLDPSTSAIVHSFSLQNFQTMLTHPVYLTVAVRTIVMAGLVTLSCAVLAFPIAYYIARVAPPRRRQVLTVLVVLPLWSSYLVRVFAWRIILAPNGPLDWAAQRLGLGGFTVGYSDLAGWIVFTYLWLPYMILPVYAGLERIPGSLLEASGDLGAHSWTTFRWVIFPLAVPALVAGSIFTFSLTLGDYITPPLVMNSQFIGNVIYSSQGVAGDIPFAAAYALVPVGIMAIYLLLARRSGAFESL